ncbi:SNARE domain- containing protein [Aspergillus clavatus NRRL 1]|uniref:SNARE complex subunit (Bet1), putative n=1 Tax=Aspergillus clavatus (strain ATCC 1007 / CBS 513.65 / DSM 816 / NCTC 3887 / NRRL 1 / QM 1276 / 107) TaxID=344612 RepID=A1CQS6_ASPCL|nr:SNARE complex subunit (Bet1), putative [Aspergillus clavatus NRRL 1]EAW07997.1 SNARE complex subunit (Bet1), putative [Aspergillus clavatus NRRL 1]
MQRSSTHGHPEKYLDFPDANKHIGRFSRSTLHQRDPRGSASLFDSYGGDSRPASRSPANVGGYGYGGYSRSGSDGHMNGSPAGGFRKATPDNKGHYSDAVLDHLESQNDSQVEGISAKVKMLKDLTLAIGDEIRDTSTITELNDAFDNTRVRLRGNMTRMLRMAERTGVGWRVWLGFFLVVFLIFAYVWLT